MPTTISPIISYVVLTLSGGVVTLATGFSGFSVFLISPFVALAAAATIAKRNVIVRFAVVLGSLFLVLDGLFLYSLFMHSGSSTDPIALAILKFLQFGCILPLLVAAMVVGRGNWKHGRSIV